MKRLAVTMFAVAALACGAPESAEPGGDATAPVSAQSATEPEAPTGAETAAESAGEDPQAQSCLDLVARAEFQQALPVCAAALRANPANQEVQDALARAKAETAKLADASEAAGHAVEDAAADKMQDGVRSLAE